MLYEVITDTQNYVRCAEAGLGIYELPRWQARQDLDGWQGIMAWLNRRETTTRPADEGVLLV